MATFHATFQTTGDFHVSFDSTEQLTARFGEVVSVSDYETYDGAYVVKAGFVSDKILNTDGKVMVDDVTVQKIPVVYTSNIYDGQTVIIG